MDWISVDDELPKIEVVIGWVNLPGTPNNWAARSGIVNKDGKFYMNTYNRLLECSHWMPLPEPPNE